MTAAQAPSAPGLRIGEVAQRAGTTPRTIRYYEELGLLSAATEREAGSHRLYTEADVEHLAELLRMKDLLGLSLDELHDLVAVSQARSALREEWRHGAPSPDRRRAIIDEAVEHIDRQLALVHRRREKLDELEDELVARRATVLARHDEIDA